MAFLDVQDGVQNEDEVTYSSEEDEEEPRAPSSAYIVRGRKGATVRALAELSSPVVAVLDRGSNVEVVEERQVGDTLRCRLAQGGWVSAKLLEMEASCSELAELQSQTLCLVGGDVDVRTREGSIGGLRCTIVAVARQPCAVLVLAHDAECGSQDLVDAAHQLVTDHMLREAAIFLPESPSGSWWDPASDCVEMIRDATQARELRCGGRVAPLAADLEPRVDRHIVSRAAAMFDEVIRAALEMTGAEHVVIGGRGQGGTLAFEVFKTMDRAPDGLVLLSPRSLFMSATPLKHGQVPIVLTHATDKFPALVTRAARRSLEVAGAANVEFCDQTADTSYRTLRAIANVVKLACCHQRLDESPTPELSLRRARAHRNLSFNEFKRDILDRDDGARGVLPSR